MKTAQEIRAMMRGGNATIGTWLQFPSADVAEVMGASGYDWVAVDMEHGALQHPLEAQSGLGVDVVGAFNAGSVFVHEVRQFLPKLVGLGCAGAQHFGGGGVVQQRKQQVLDRDEFMALLASLYKGQVQTDFEFLGNHELFLD